MIKVIMMIIHPLHSYAGPGPSQPPARADDLAVPVSSVPVHWQGPLAGNLKESSYYLWVVVFSDSESLRRKLVSYVLLLMAT